MQARSAATVIHSSFPRNKALPHGWESRPLLIYSLYVERTRIFTFWCVAVEGVIWICAASVQPPTRPLLQAIGYETPHGCARGHILSSLSSLHRPCNQRNIRDGDSTAREIGKERQCLDVDGAYCRMDFSMREQFLRQSMQTFSRAEKHKDTMKE